MLSLGVAICFDYSLFMLNRYREEVVMLKHTHSHAVLMSLAASGHVVVLSGCILLFTFLLLITFPQVFLQSVGITCSTVVVTSMLTNMSLTPALLLACPHFFSKFELLPNVSKCCTGGALSYKQHDGRHSECDANIEIGEGSTEGEKDFEKIKHTDAEDANESAVYSDKVSKIYFYYSRISLT
jgi:hypothetical protein